MINGELDDTDKNILNLLQQDCRLTLKEIAHRLHKSLTPVHVRVKRLQDEGYIKRYAALLNPKKIQRGLIAFTQVQVRPHSQETLQNFKLEVVKITEVMECYHMTGTFDFLLKIAIRDMEAYDQLVTKKLSMLPDVGNLQSLFVMSEVKNESAFELGK
jgi:Lrp/AsnC family leucine-responsive transcriptional regulator